MSKDRDYKRAGTIRRGSGMKSSILLFIAVFAILGLLLGYAASFDVERLPENIEQRDPAMQQLLFKECINDARLDGELTDEEYNKCAYSIYD
jgi:hypothetical protein